MTPFSIDIILQEELWPAGYEGGISSDIRKGTFIMVLKMVCTVVNNTDRLWTLAAEFDKPIVALEPGKWFKFVPKQELYEQ